MEAVKLFSSRFHFLMVDDDEDDKLFMSAALKDVGYTKPLKCFSNGLEMLNYLKTLHDKSMPILILMDLNMPKKDGKSALREIRNNPGLSHVEVIIYSTSNSDQDISDTYALGCNAYIIKPSCYEDIKKIALGIKNFWIDRLFGKRKTSRSLVSGFTH